VTGHASLEINADDFDYKEHHAVSVEAQTLDTLLEASSITQIDLLSLDVEGTEIDVLKGFDLQKYCPKLILLEDKFLYLEKHFFLKKHGYSQNTPIRAHLIPPELTGQQISLIYASECTTPGEPSFLLRLLDNPPHTQRLALY